jgi:hypothetical protein
MYATTTFNRPRVVVPSAAAVRTKDRMGEGRENRKGNLEQNQKTKDEIRNRSTSSWRRKSCSGWTSRWTESFAVSPSCLV